MSISRPRTESSVDALTGSLESSKVTKNCYLGNTIAVFTSGGDAQGMNAAVRAVVRMALYTGCHVFVIREGYQGMVDGGENIEEVFWGSVSNIIQYGGTIIGSARCMDFKERWGRLKAAENLILHGITNLVCIGGDGSLTGANLFKLEWQSLIDELVSTGRIDQAARDRNSELYVVGLVGSIDNDFCSTDMTLGADSALTRIIEATDAITTTAFSHKRCFVMEVMGRHCGYLALVSSIVTEADYVFIPEMPPPDNWQDDMCDRLLSEREQGQRLNIVIVSEGAIDRSGNGISSELVRKTISDRLKLDTRVTILGHVQRGGNPSAFDRILACRMGAEAVLALLSARQMKNPLAQVIAIHKNHIIRVPMMMAVEQTKAVTQAMAEKKYELAVQLRGRSFCNNLQIYQKLSNLRPPSQIEVKFTVAVINIGAPCCGINACVRTFVRYALSLGYNVLAIQDGMVGFAEGKNKIKKILWSDVRGWNYLGGSKLGINRKLLEGREKEVAASIKEFGIQGLFIVGGFEAFVTGYQFEEQRQNFDEFKIPIIIAPATISNNIPGTEFSIGSDTALNEITQILDRIKQSAKGTRRRVFLVETMGGYCGYLCSMAGIASGADAAYIYEEPTDLKSLKNDVEHITTKMDEGIKRGTIIRHENCHDYYDMKFMSTLFKSEAKGRFSLRENVLGHVQQGGYPTVFDRNLGVKFATKSLNHMVEQLQKYQDPTTKQVVADDSESISLIGYQFGKTEFTPLQTLKPQVDFVRRTHKNPQWWMNLRSLMMILAKINVSYNIEAI